MEEKKIPYYHHSKADILQYVVYSCFCAQVYDYNCVKMCIQNSCYIIFVELLLNIFMLKFSNVPYNSVFITKLIMFVSVTIVIHTKRKKLENTVN